MEETIPAAIPAAIIEPPEATDLRQNSEILSAAVNWPTISNSHHADEKSKTAEYLDKLERLLSTSTHVGILMRNIKNPVKPTPAMAREGLN